MRRAGLLAASAGGKDAGGKLEAPPGARRIRRTIVTLSEGGQRSEREVIYTDREKVGAGVVTGVLWVVWNAT